MSTRIREQQLAWGLLAPALVVLGAFGLFPIGYALYVSLHKWRIKKEAVVGLDHYVRAVGNAEYLLPFVAGDLAKLIVASLAVPAGWALLDWFTAKPDHSSE